MDLSTIGKEIRARRRSANLTQEALARAAGVSRVTINALETGRAAETGVQKLVKILAALGAELVVRTEPARPTYDQILARRLEADRDQPANPRFRE